MARLIKGITVTLVNLVEVGVDPFNNPIFESKELSVNNVLVAPASQPEILEATNLFGKKAVYTIAIPKDDNHEWIDQKVILPSPFTGEYRVFGFPAVGIDENIPLDWNAKYMLELYG